MRACLLLFALAAGPTFRAEVVDAGFSGDCKALGDLDGDGLLDLVAGGRELNWYSRNPWTAHRIAVCQQEFTTDMETGDVDGDGDIDIVVPDGLTGLLWFENPGWQRHLIGISGQYDHDVEVGDIDGDGRLDAAARPKGETIHLWLNRGERWEHQTVGCSGGEGLDVADVDGDGRLDLVVGGEYYAAAAWERRTVAPDWIGRDVKVEVADLGGDARMDIAYTPSEGTFRIEWYEATDGGWRPHLLAREATGVHSLAVADFDGDGRLDVATAAMHTSEVKEVVVWLLGGRVRRLVIGRDGSHNLVAGDFDGDGDADLAGCNWIGTPPLTVWWNELTPRR